MKRFTSTDNHLINNEEWYLEDLTNKEFKKFCYLVAEGKLPLKIINNKDKINNIYKEAYRRKIFPPYETLNIHSWALYNYGYYENCPKLSLDRFSKQKLYQVVFQDNNNNLYNIGYYHHLEEAIPDINACLNIYEDINIKKEDLEKCMVTLGEWYNCFYLCLNSLYSCKNDNLYIRGFVYDYEELLEELRGN